MSWDERKMHSREEEEEEQEETLGLEDEGPVEKKKESFTEEIKENF